MVGVDIVTQPNYPFTFVRADALSYAVKGFHAIHASPPCQDRSALTAGNRRRPGWSDDHVNMIPAVRTILADAHRSGVPTVIENVQGSELRRDLVLCGLTFGLQVYRHRYFEVAGFTAIQPEHPSHAGHRVAGWRHGVRYDGDMVAVYGEGGGKGSLAVWRKAMGIDWMDRDEIREAIPPAYTEYVGRLLRPACA